MGTKQLQENLILIFKYGLTIKTDISMPKVFKKNLSFQPIQEESI